MRDYVNALLTGMDGEDFGIEHGSDPIITDSITLHRVDWSEIIDSFRDDDYNDENKYPEEITLDDFDNQYNSDEVKQFGLDADDLQDYEIQEQMQDYLSHNEGVVYTQIDGDGKHDNERIYKKGFWPNKAVGPYHIVKKE